MTDDRNQNAVNVCRQKKSFATKRDAKLWWKRMRKVGVTTTCRPYRCTICERWHLTSMDAEGRAAHRAASHGDEDAVARLNARGTRRKIARLNTKLDEQAEQIRVLTTERNRAFDALGWARECSVEEFRSGE